MFPSFKAGDIFRPTLQFKTLFCEEEVLLVYFNLTLKEKGAFLNRKDE